MRLAAGLIAAGQGQDAVKALSDWLSRFPKDVVARRALAEAYLAIGDKAAARGEYKTIVKESPDDSSSMNNLAYLMNEAGEKDALTYARRAHELAPDNSDVNDTLGWILVQRNKPEEGLRYLRDAQSREGGSGVIEYHIAAALVALGRNREARSALDTALSHGNSFSEIGDARALRAKLGN